MSCFGCGLDFCLHCALLLQPTAGASLIKIKLRHHEKDGMIDPTLKLGWVHAVSTTGVARCGPYERRDHGYLVTRATYDGLRLKYQALEQQMAELRSSEQVKDTSSPMVCDTQELRRLRHPRGSLPSPALFMFGQPSGPRERQQKYCTTQVKKMQEQLEAKELEFEGVRCDLEKRASHSMAFALTLQEQAREQRIRQAREWET